LVGLAVSAAPAQAQQPPPLADNRAVTPAADDLRLPLAEGLARVAEQHDVTFLYASLLLDGKHVPRRAVLPAQLDGQLRRMLAPHGLAFVKVGPRSYAIVARSETPARASATATGLEPALQGTVTGTVTDAAGTPLPGVQVALEGTTQGDVTGGEGQYRIASVPPGDYTLRATFVGYAPETAAISVADGATVTQDFVLREDVMQMEGAVVTGTRTERRQRETTNSVSVLDAQTIQEINPNSQADVLRGVPGIHTEGGGGELASNVFIRGLPAPGQYRYISLQENGMPLISEIRPTTSAQDIYFRYDLNVERMEFVRGGSSALFGVGSPAGIINYISKTGGASNELVLQGQVGQDNLYRFGFNANGPLTEDLRYSLGGYYRYDEGPVVTGLPTQGGQVKGNITYLQDNGYIRLYGKYIDDRAQFFLPFPHDARTQEAATGNDGREITTLNAEGAADFSFENPDGRFLSQMENGILTRGGALQLELVRDLGAGFSLESDARYTSMYHEFNIFIPFPAFQLPGAYADRFGAATDANGDPILGPNQRARYTFTNGDGAFQPMTGGQQNYLVDQGAWNWVRPYTEFAADARVKSEIGTDAFDLNLTAGAYLSRTAVRQRDTHSSVLVEFADQPRLVDLAIENAGPDGTFGTADDTETAVTRNGLSSASNFFLNNEIASNRVGGYLGGEINLNDRFRVDAGLQVGLRQAEFVVEGTGPVGGDGAFGDALAVQNFTWGNGTFTRQQVRSSDVAASIGLNAALTDALNAYVVGSRAYYFPELASLTTSTTIGDIDNEQFWQAEGGLKLGSSQLSGTLAFYFTQINNRFSAGQRQDPQTGNVVVVAQRIGGSRTLGTELTLAYAPDALDGLRLDGMFTYQGHEYTDFPSPGEDGELGTSDDDDFSGNQIRRQPVVMGQGGVSYEAGGFDVRLAAKYTGNRFADEANFQRLDAYTVVNGGLGYTFSFGDTESVRLGLNVFNLFNSRGLTEGDPRLPPGVDPTDQPFFNARPILPRRITAKVTYRL
jgi:outer membrane receptor protein involved in Fe transport